jgi:hypothetical protein
MDDNTNNNNIPPITTIQTTNNKKLPPPTTPSPATATSTNTIDQQQISPTITITSSNNTTPSKRVSLVRRLFTRSQNNNSNNNQTPNQHLHNGGGIPKRLVHSEGSTGPLSMEEQERRSAVLLAERTREIEQAASERDEKRKNRVGDALTLMRSRLDDAGDAIRGEMHVAVQRAFWTREEVLHAALIIFLALFTFPILKLLRTIFGDDFYHEYRALFPLVYASLMISFTWFMSRGRIRDARIAEDVINFRLEDLESKIHLCFDALIHNLEEADDTWAARLEEQQREWEARQQELERRRPMIEPNKLPLRPPRKMHPYEAARKLKALQVGATQRARELLNQVPGPSAVFGTRNRSPSGGKNLAGSSSTGAADLTDVEHHPQATKAWIKYVMEELSMERLADMTAEEREYAKEIDANTEDKFSKLPHDLQLMVLRGFADKKDKRMQVTIEGVNYIAQWRAETRSDELLTFIDPKSIPYFKGWPTKIGGEDMYGHIIVYDRIETMDIESLCQIDDKDILHYRTQQCETIRYLKQRNEAKLGHRVAKNVYIMDLGALSLRKHFTGKVKSMLQPIFRVNGDAYPDSLWSLWLINTPLAFRVVWTFISPIIDPSTKNKIKMVGGKDAYIPAMEKCGIPISSLPKELGGEYNQLDLFEILKETVATNQAAAARSSAPAGSDNSTVTVASSSVVGGGGGGSVTNHNNGGGNMTPPVSPIHAGGE